MRVPLQLHHDGGCCLRRVDGPNFSRDITQTTNGSSAARPGLRSDDHRGRVLGRHPILNLVLDALQFGCHGRVRRDDARGQACAVDPLFRLWRVFGLVKYSRTAWSSSCTGWTTA